MRLGISPLPRLDVTSTPSPSTHQKYLRIASHFLVHRQVQSISHSHLSVTRSAGGYVCNRACREGANLQSHADLTESLQWSIQINGQLYSVQAFISNWKD